MTREEAIAYGNDYYRDLISACFRIEEKHKEFVRMSLKALDQESCDNTVSRGVFEQVMWERDTAIEQLRELGYELGQKIESCDDCVSRSAVLAIAGDSCLDLDSYEDTKEFCDAIKELPPVLPKREQGKWSKNVDNGFRKYKCSKCHNFNDFNSKYCPHCGAEMVIKSCSTCKHDGELVCATHGCHNKEKYEVK